MEKELEPEVIRATQSSLGKYVKRPPLTEKLLKKPPFRFLHDIVTTVLKNTGFFEGLFEPNELISENVKERENKIAFLNKVITVLESTTGTSLGVKPSKIVAGQEPDKTNELLQCLAQALDKNLSSEEAVKKFKEHSKSSQNIEKKTKEQSKTVKKLSDEKKLTSKSTEQLTTKKRDPADRSLTRNEKDRPNPTTKSKQKENSVIKKESPPKKSTIKSVVKKNSVEKVKASDNDTKQDKNFSEPVNETQNVPKPKINSKDGEDPQLSQDKGHINHASTNEQQKSIVEQDGQDKLNASYTIADNDLNSSLSSQDLMEVENNKVHGNIFEQKPNTADANSELKIKTDESTKESTILVESSVNEPEENKYPKADSTFDTQKESDTSLEKGNTQDKNTKTPTGVTRPSSVRPSSSRPGAPRLREKHDNVLTATENFLVGKVNIIVENSPNEEEEESIILVEQQTDPLLNQDQQEQRPLSSSQQHGHLVQQILESQKEFSQISGKTEIEWQFGAQKAREALNQEIEQLRFNIQALSRVANPLGKLLDHIQEDVEVMRQELQQWTKTYEETSKELQKQKAVNEDSLLPLHTKLKQLDVDMEEKRDKINDLKIIIYKNSTRIKKLLENGNVQ